AGRLLSLEASCDDLPRRESLMYLEIDRAAASARQLLVAEIEAALADVRAAVDDWKMLQAKLHDDAQHLHDEERSALLHWFADGAMTLLGYQVARPAKSAEATPPETRPETAAVKATDPETEGGALGLLRHPGAPLWDEDSTAAAIDYFERGGRAPLIAKADRLSSVHRRVPFDLVVVPIRGPENRVDAVGMHAGLWTSQALRAPADDVPVLRRRLAALEEELGFDPRGHAGKALRHSIAALPRDLLVSLERDAVKQLVVTAMSLADRPRPALVVLQSILKGHFFAFVWLPRDELTSRRRHAIGQMLEQAAAGTISNWSIELGDRDLALARYTIDVPPGSALPDSAALNARLHEMVRGWEPSVEEALAPLVGAARATRLALTLVRQFPESYRARIEAAEAAQDVLRIAALHDDEARDVRLFRRADDEPGRLRLVTYRRGGTIALSEAVPVFENFGFRVLEEQPTPIDAGPIGGSAIGGRPIAGGSGTIHEFLLESAQDCEALLSRAAIVERAIAAVLEQRAENDSFNQLLVAAALEPDDVVLLRAWFRYLRQTGLSYGLTTAVEALRKAPAVARGLITLFRARHEPSGQPDDDAAAGAEAMITEALAGVAAIDEDRLLRLLRCIVLATLRTNAFSADREALAFKLDSSLIPGLPAPVPWREIWVYSPRVEGIHLRAGPVARGGIRWSDRRDDFRTEVLSLMKAQVVKNAVIVPTGAKGGFYPKQLPPPAQRDAWLAEGADSYAIFIRALLSLTDNIVAGAVVHPEGIRIRDGEDPYFVVAADKGTATFSDLANSIALARDFWLGDAFASGGSHGYDHKAMAITARGAWVSVQRHFAELGVDVQNQPVRVAGCGDMSGDVFGNGMLLSKAIKLVAAFDHRHIFIDPDPDPAASWEERRRLFGQPRSSWDDYDRKIVSKGGGIFARTQKSIPLTPEMQRTLGIEAAEADPTTLITAILKAPVDLFWFGGIGTYVKAEHENDVEVGDPGNDAVRVDALAMRAKVIGEGANLAVTQAGRIEFALGGGRINTDFIDNSAGVDCSDKEVNIKIALNAEMAEGRLSFEERNQLLAEMTDDVAAIVLEDNRLQTLALSIAERGGAAALPPLARAIEVLEESGRLNRAVEGLESNEDLLRRAQEGQGLTRPELAVLLSTSKLALQDAIEASPLADDPTLDPDLFAIFPDAMRQRHEQAILRHRLRREIVATTIANRFINRLGILAPFALTEQEGVSWAQAAAGLVAAERLFDIAPLWRDIEAFDGPEAVRLELFEQAGAGLRLHIADIVRSTAASIAPGEIVTLLQPGLAKLDASLDALLRTEPRAQAEAIAAQLSGRGAPAGIVDRIVRLFKLNGAIGIAALGRRRGTDEVALTCAYTKLGEALGLDWAQSAANRFQARDPWESLLAAGLARDFEQLRLDFLDRDATGDPEAAVTKWVETQSARVEQFRRTIQRVRTAPVTTLPMIAEIATQARVLLARGYEAAATPPQ
ncbi:MAG: glutamate dehydrogenase, partial [Alphaproteobacteria bacterium]|nr:glutamate dehydrogenase [Alphaproteobacteria bacterium]